MIYGRFNGNGCFEVVRVVEPCTQLGRVQGMGKFSEEQMRIIELGFRCGLDVTYYAKPCFNARQMLQIYYGMMQGLDVTVYASDEYTWQKMRDIRHELEDKEIATVDAKEDSIALQLAAYKAEGFNDEQLAELKLGLEADLDVSVYAKKIHSAKMMNCLRRALAVGEDLSYMANTGCSVQHLEEFVSILEKQN